MYWLGRYRSMHENVYGLRLEAFQSTSHLELWKPRSHASLCHIQESLNFCHDWGRTNDATGSRRQRRNPLEHLDWRHGFDQIKRLQIRCWSIFKIDVLLGLALVGKTNIWVLAVIFCWAISGELMILRNIQSSVATETHRIKIKTTTSDTSTYFWSFSYSRSKSLSTCGEMETCREIWEEWIESLFKEVCGQTALVFYKLSWVCNHKNRIYRAWRT